MSTVRAIAADHVDVLAHFEAGWQVCRQRTFLLALADVRADDFPLP